MRIEILYTYAVFIYALFIHAYMTRQMIARSPFPAVSHAYRTCGHIAYSSALDHIHIYSRLVFHLSNLDTKGAAGGNVASMSYPMHACA